MTPLFVAANEGSPRMVKALLDKGADPNATDDVNNLTMFYYFSSSVYLFIHPCLVVMLHPVAMLQVCSFNIWIVG